jgi:cyanoexosortase A
MKISHFSDRTWLFSSLISLSILYLNLIWKTTGDIDILTTDCLFWGAILWLLWRKRDQLSYNSNPISSFLGLFLIGVVLFKTLSLFWFETELFLPLFPLFAAVGLALIASGFRGLSQYGQELFFAWFLFFPTGVVGFFLENFLHFKILTAKFATFFLYYVGFNVANQGNEILLHLPELGNFKALVNYSCTGIPMILLMLKIALLLITFFSFGTIKQILIPIVSIGLGFILGVIRVCIMTLVLHDSSRFDYWHGSQGSQIFSTAGIIIFSGFCYWIWQREIQKEELNNRPSLSTDLQ